MAQWSNGLFYSVFRFVPMVRAWRDYLRVDERGILTELKKYQKKEHDAFAGDVLPSNAFVQLKSRTLSTRGADD